MNSWKVTAIIKPEDDGFFALCPEFDVASQGETIAEAEANLAEAVTLFLETAATSEVSRRYQPKSTATTS